MPAKRMPNIPKDNWSCPECTWAGVVPSFMFSATNRVEAIMCPQCFCPHLTCYLTVEERKAVVQQAEEEAKKASVKSNAPWDEEIHW